LNLQTWDLISIKYLQNNTIFYFTIDLTSVHIERYLSWRAEFETKINQITVDFGSFSLVPLPPPPRSCHHNSRQTTRNNPDTSPSPLLRDVGSTTNTLGCAGRTATQPQPHLPHPFSKGCGRFVFARWGIGDRVTQGGTQRVGGPCSTSRKTNHGGCRRGSFLAMHLSIPQPTLTIPNPTQCQPPTWLHANPTTRRQTANDARLKPNDEGLKPNDEGLKPNDEGVRPTTRG